MTSNDDTGLTLSIFMIWLNLFPNASARVKAYTAHTYISKLFLIQHIICTQVSDIGRMVLWFLLRLEGSRLWERKMQFQFVHDHINEQVLPRSK